MKMQKKQTSSAKPRRTTGGRIINTIGIILCILFFPCVIVNMTLLIGSLIYPDVPPNFMGYTPLVVESDSMVPFFAKNDLVLIRNEKDSASYAEGTVICFRSRDVYVSHRIVKTTTDADGTVLYTTQGDANNTPDAESVRPEQIIGAYVTHIDGMGEFVLFMQTPMGMLCCVILPMLLIFLLFWMSPKITDALQRRRMPNESPSH